MGVYVQCGVGTIGGEIVGSAVGLVLNICYNNVVRRAFFFLQTLVQLVESVVVVRRDDFGYEQSHAQQQQTDENGVDNTQVPKVFVYVVHFFDVLLPIWFCKVTYFFLN